MTPKEKAKQLVDKFRKFVDFTDEDFNTSLSHETNRAKECALIAVYEIIKYAETFGDVTDLDVDFYLQVKQELEK